MISSVKAELFEERGLLGVELDAADEGRLEALQEAQDALVLGFGVDPDGGEVVGDLIAEDTLDEVEVVVDEGGRLGLDSERCLMSAQRLRRKRRSERSSSSLAPEAAVRTMKPPAASPFLREQDLLKTPTLAVGLDLAGDAGVIDGGHEDEEATGEGDVRGDARTLLGDRLLGDLDEELLPGLEQIADGGEVGGLGGVPMVTTAAVAHAAGASAAIVGAAGRASAVAFPAAATAVASTGAAPIGGRLTAAVLTVVVGVAVG